MKPWLFLNYKLNLNIFLLKKERNMFGQDSFVFKQKLYENFKQSGLLSRLQATLRSNLLQKIQKPNINSQQQKSKLDNDQSKPFHLKKKFLHNIIHQYLQKQRMQYTLSIFMPQSNLNEKDLLKFDVISQITNFPKYQSQSENRSFLQCLIEEWVKKNCNQRRQRSIQTDVDGDPVEKKIENIQKNYLAKIDYWKLIPNKQVSDNPTLYEHQQKLKAQFQVQKQKIKLNTQRIVKAQMQRKFQSQYQFRLNQITKQHQKRLQQLKDRQKLILQSLQRKKTELEEKSKQLSKKQLQLIQKYQTRQKEIKAYYLKRQADIENRQNQFWKKQLELKAKKRQYQDTIRLVKQKAIGQTGQMPHQESVGGRFNVTNFTGKSSFLN